MHYSHSSSHIVQIFKEKTKNVIKTVICEIVKKKKWNNNLEENHLSFNDNQFVYGGLG